jgi:hypothetical protein
VLDEQFYDFGEELDEEDLRLAEKKKKKNQKKKLKRKLKKNNDHQEPQN